MATFNLQGNLRRSSWRPQMHGPPHLNPPPPPTFPLPPYTPARDAAIDSGAVSKTNGGFRKSILKMEKDPTPPWRRRGDRGRRRRVSRRPQSVVGLFAPSTVHPEKGVLVLQLAEACGADASWS